MNPRTWQPIPTPALPLKGREAAVIAHPRAFSGWVDLLRLAVRLDRELVSSRRGYILLVARHG